MSDEWVETTLAELCAGGSFGDGDWVESKDQDPSGDFRLLQLADIGDGLFLNKSDRWMNEEQFKRLSCTELQTNDLLIARMPDPIARACLVPEGLPRSATVVDVAIVRTGDDLLQRFLCLLINGASFRQSAQSLLTGTTRQRISRGNLAKIVIRLPPLAVQRRIVDLMAHLDNHLANLRAERDRAVKLVRPMIDGLVEGVSSAPLMRMGAVGEFIRGRRFTKADYVPVGLACIHYAQIHTHLGSITEEPLTYVPVEMRTRLRLARTGDVVIAATSEDMDGLGKATVWLGQDEVAVHDDCYIFRHSLDPVFATYLFSSSWFQEQKQRYAAGTKVTRISGKDLAAIEVPVPPIAVQVRIGLALRALSASATSIQGEIDSLENVRSQLLSLLLAGEVVLPDSYDSLLVGVA